MGREGLFLLLLMVATASCKFYMFHPKGQSCTDASTEEENELYLGEFVLVPGGVLRVVSVVGSDFAASIRFFICPQEVPLDYHGSWRFNCSDRIPLQVKNDPYLSQLDTRLIHYKNMTVTQLQLPDGFTCLRCGLQAEVAHLPCRNCPPTYLEDSCTFLSIGQIWNKEPIERDTYYPYY
ncbi:uncharacterized protein LOC123509295 [Portunus trituberculatus]|uniref:uncharacterized protein LOC123509295 n=1 Tax=Portunus trituberculatus TaxID=210409 RepID=UPI001E1CF67E|nr:uncharacterized protein LOC123509295 [Portunus trituberculatus]